MTDVLNITKNSFAIDVEKFAASLSTIPVGVKRLTDTAILPAFATAGAACFDLHADLRADGYNQVYFRESEVIRTGLAFDIPEGYALMIYSRSGHGFKNDVRLANCVGVIDSDYTGEVKIKLTIDNEEGFIVEHGSRIAQAMLIKVPCVQLVEVDELKTTERGANGFGSTGTSANVVTAEEEAATHPIMTSRHLDKK
ncbi:dTUPase [Escherichia phage SeppeHuegi]|nr:dTUPase [Escherichia phage SeppeHuegi]